MSVPPENSVKIEEVIQQLQSSAAMPAELLEIFNEEAEDHLGTIYEGLDRLQLNRNDQTALASVRRASHTLKGAAGAVKLQSATRLSHRMEDLLDQLARHGEPVTEQQLKLLLATADQLQGLTTCDFDMNAVASQIVELYDGYAREIGEQAPVEVPGGAADSDPEPQEKKSVADRAGDQASVSKPHLRVPLDRLDDLVSLLGEMIVNRSEFQQRLHDFESRIEDMQSAMERLRNISQCVENHSHQTNHAVADNSPTAGNFSAGTDFKNRDEFDQLEFEQYDNFYLLEQTLAEADKDAEIMSGEFRSVKSAFDVLLRRQHQLNRDAQKSLMRIRMVPLSGIKNRIERTVRTVSGKLGRQVTLDFDGEAIELDKTVLDAITDPILHLVRNAIDHGIEDKDARMAAGKPETASLRLEAVNEGTKVVLRVIDDGAGINLEKVRQKALQQELIQADQELTPDQLHSLIFLPGFSTAKQLTDVSGRGVGMDVVGDAINRLKGTIRVNSAAGVGTTFTIELPTTLGVTRAMMVETQGKTFAIPMPSVKKTVQLCPDRVKQLDGERVLDLDDKNIRIFDLGAHLQLRENNPEIMKSRAPTLILGRRHEHVAVTVDSILGCQDIVVKTLGDHLKHVRGINGVTIGGDGAVIPILDASMLIQQDTHPLAVPIRRDFSSPIIRKNLAMVIDDSISVRRVTTNILKFAGWDVVTAKDGVDALEQLGSMDTPPDVFLCDMEMPRMDGLETIRQIREQQEFEFTPVVMVTSRAGEKHRQKAFEAGATEYVVKPFNDEQLLELISRLVQESREMVLA